MNRLLASLLAASLFLFSSPPSFSQSAMDTCLANAIKTLDDSTTIGELKLICEGESGSATTPTAPAKKARVPVYELSALDERFSAERAVEDRPFVITPHNPNYIMFTSFDDPNQAPFEEVTGLNEPVEDTEMKFQVSIKAPIWRNILGRDIDGYFAYTAQSWWQLFNDDISSPFRETNYEPELFIRSFTDYNVLGGTLAGWSLGFNHQSNGRAEPLSRSWNRIIGRAGFEVNENLSVLTRLWYRIPEDEEDDDNPRMYKYYGYGDIRAIWTPNRNTVTALLRPGTDKTSFELTWSYPISNIFRVYAQYYKGYGESLVDYDYDNERIGIGITMNDYLMRQ